MKLCLLITEASYSAYDTLNYLLLLLRQVLLHHSRQSIFRYPELKVGKIITNIRYSDFSQSLRKETTVYFALKNHPLLSKTNSCWIKITLLMNSLLNEQNLKQNSLKRKTLYCFVSALSCVSNRFFDFSNREKRKK